MKNLHTQRSHGFSLIELMIALVLGLVIIGGVISVLLSSKTAYRTNENLASVQENQRMAFELLVRDIREAGMTPCGNTGRVANVLKGSADWWLDFGNALRGYDSSQTDPAVVTGTAVAQRVAGTDSIHILRGDDASFTVASHMDQSATIELNEDSTGLLDGDILMICSPEQAAIFQVSSSNPAGTKDKVIHNTGNALPGNCSKGLGFPTPADCGQPGGKDNFVVFPPNSAVARLSSVAWYIGNNGRAASGGRSLYRMRIVNNAGVAAPAAEEMIEGISNMQLTYLVRNAATYQPANSISAANWANVVAVRLQLTVQGPDERIDTQQQTAADVNTRLERTTTYTIQLRNR